MKTQASPRKTFFSLLFSNFSKNFFSLFESGNKKDFQRLKDFITTESFN